MGVFLRLAFCWKGLPLPTHFGKVTLTLPPVNRKEIHNFKMPLFPFTSPMKSADFSIKIPFPMM